MALSSEQIDLISRHVCRQFPEMKGAAPMVQSQPMAKTLGQGRGGYILVFRGRGQGPGGRAILRIVRVVADDHGKVVKISTSR